MYMGCDAKAPARQTDIRAGQIKAALDAGPMTPQVEKLFRAAARAAAESGAPLMVHIERGGDPVALADRLEGWGAPPGRTIFCHMDRSVADIGVHRELCARGIYMEYDTVARPRHHSDAREIGIVAEMLEAGHGARLLMGTDATRARLRAYSGPSAPGLGYMLEKFIPAMEQRGVARPQIEAIFVGNPARAFSIDGWKDGKQT
jgi:phosphotriesterase-related protein